jgi:hypothetical protein
LEKRVLAPYIAAMPGQNRSERVASLFGQLEAIEHAMVSNREALFALADLDPATSLLGDLRSAAEALEAAAEEIVAKIQEHVEDTSAFAVFRPIDILL